MNKYFKLLTALLVVLMVFVSPAKAEIVPEDDITIVSVTIDGVEFDYEDITSGNVLIFAPVYLDSEFDIEVEWQAGENLSRDDVEAKIEVEFDGDDQDTEYFDVRSNWHGSDSFEEFQIDDDEDLLGEEPIQIMLRSKDGFYRDEVTIILDITRMKNEVQIYDVNFRNGLDYDAGDSISASVGVANEGNKDEEDVFIRMSIPELDLTTRSDRFDLVTDDNGNRCDNDDDTDCDKLHKTLTLDLPNNVPVGVYDVEFEVLFDDGEDKEVQVYSIEVVRGTDGGVSGISMDSEEQSIEAGKSIVYKVLFGTQADYDVEVSGIDFGSYSVRVEDEQAYIFVNVDENTQAGDYEFTVDVKSGDNVVESFDVVTKVVDEEGNGNADYSAIRQGLEIGFVVLLVILVILGIILVAKKLGKGDDIEEPTIDEEQTYY